MPATVEDVIAKTEVLVIEPTTDAAMKPTTKEEKKANGIETKTTEAVTEKPGREGITEAEGKEKDKNDDQVESENEPVVEAKKQDVPVEIEPRTGVSFPLRLDDRKQLKAVGLRKKGILGMGIKIYGFGLYADNEKMKDIVTTKVGKAPAKPMKEMYQMVIDSDVGMTVRLVIVFSNLTMGMVRKSFDEGLGAAIKKLTGGKNEELPKRVMGEVSDDTKLTPGSVIEISRLPGYVLQTKVKGETISTVESEVLCRAFLYLYLGDDPFDKEAKEKFGTSLLSLF